MNLSARLASIALLSVGVVFAGVGCAADPAEADANDTEATGGVDGEGSSEDELVSERQLMGSELPEKTVSLTFDDGPGPRTAELAEYLAGKGIHATFFINGKNVAGRQAAIDTIVGRGHLLANHTHNHLQLTRQSAEKVVSEVSLTDALIERAQPDAPSLIRAPFGAWNANTARAINASPMKKYVGSVFWDVGGALTNTAAADWDCWGKSVSVQRCGELYVQETRAKKRGIILMHDTHGKTVDMVKTVLVPQLIADGYTFAKLPDVPSVKRALEANSDGPPPANGCSSSTLGKTVPENACVQSRTDQKWYRCVAGEWAASSTTDSKCIARHPIP